jgi:hypothetical protein
VARYIGETYSIPLEQGGFCHNKNIDTIDPFDMVHPSCNIWLNEGGIRKRGGTAPVDTESMGAVAVMGIFDHRLANGNQHIIRATSDGKLWKNVTTTIKTGLVNSKYASFIQDGDILLACNGANKPMTWNGVAAAVTELTMGVKAQGTITMGGVAAAGTAAQGTITMEGVAVAYETFSIDDQVFTWKVARAKKGEVKLGATAAEAVVNLAAAINADMDTVEADDKTTTTCVITVVDLGTNGNAIIFLESSSNMAMDGSGTMGGTTAGVDEETFAINEQTFIWKAERDKKGEVTIGADAAEAVTNIVDAITKDIDTVKAEDGAGNTVVVTGADYGTDVNEFVFTEDATNMTMDGSGTMGGTATGVNSEMPSDWTGTNYPSQIIVHGRGNSKRAWALGCPLNNKTLYVSPNDSLTTFPQPDVLTFEIETGDGSGIVGGIEHGDRLVVFGKTQSFLFEDESVDTSYWGYTASQWHGGVAHQRLIVKTPNDIVCMMENGEIYSVLAAESYGDYKAASISRPSFIHEWIKEYINLSLISKFHAVYDSTLRAIKIFVIRSGKSEVDTALIYYIDRPPEKAWVILSNENFESGFSACSSAIVRASAGSWKVYTGSYAGKIWKLGELNRNDNNNAFQSRYRTPNMAFDFPREDKRYDKIRLISIAEGSCDATMVWWIDGVQSGSEDMNFATGGDILGSFILGTGILGGLNILEATVPVGQIGKRIQIEIKSNVANESFFMSQMLIDFIPLGKGE